MPPPSKAPPAASVVEPFSANFRSAHSTRSTTLNSHEGTSAFDSKGKGKEVVQDDRPDSSSGSTSLFEDEGTGAGGDGPTPVKQGDGARSSTSSSTRTASTSSAPSSARSFPTSLPRSLLFPSVADELCEDPLPATRDELYSYLHHTRATQPSVKLDYLVWLHRQPRIAPLASTKSYRFLLQWAFDASDLRLVRALLDDMRARGVKQDKAVLRVLLRGWLRHGKDGEARDVALALGESGIVMRATKPVVRGHEGRKDERGVRRVPLEEEPLWKGRALRNRDLKKEERSLRWQAEQEQPLTSRGSVSTYRRARARTTVSSTFGPIPVSPLSRRTVSVPPRPNTLSHSDISTLVDALMQDGRLPEAVELAKSWLLANRPSYSPPAKPPPPPRLFSRPPRHVFDDLAEFGRHVAAYHSTALVLLHLLLRAISRERPALTTAPFFITSFISQMSAPAPARPILPNLITLRTLLSGLLNAPNAYSDGLRLVDWFGYRWGLPSPGSPHSDRSYFRPPSFDAELERHGLDAADVAAPPAGTTALPCVPHDALSPDLTLLLLRHAVDEHDSKRLIVRSHVRRVRAWWAAQVARDPSSELWSTYDARVLRKRAAECGLLPARKERWVELRRKGVGRKRAERRVRKAEREERERREEEEGVD
ncbi:hypothetical protein JCM8097_009257 [Rhodosporidiobolus ruineniae]